MDVRAGGPLTFENLKLIHDAFLSAGKPYDECPVCGVDAGHPCDLECKWKQASDILALVTSESIDWNEWPEPKNEPGPIPHPCWCVHGPHGAPKRVKQAAIRDYNDIIYTLPRPARHHNIMHDEMRDLPVMLRQRATQGFVLEDDTFVGREEAAMIALEAGQCTKLITPPNLFSEDLW